MASFTFSSGHSFPVGTTVYAYQDLGFNPGNYRPPGTAVSSATVAAGGGLVLTGLTTGTDYWVVGQVNGVWLWVRAAVPPAELVTGVSGHEIQNEGTPLTQRDELDFVGAGVNAVDSGGKTVVSVSGAASSAGIIYASDYGVTGGALDGDQSDDFEAALLAARELAVAAGAQFARVILPAGTINLGLGRSVGFDLGPTDDGPPVILSGQGRDATYLVWSQGNDFALPGRWAFDYSGVGSGTEVISDLSIIGPAINASVLGRPPGKGGGLFVQTNGLYLAQGCRARNIKVQRFNFGIYAMKSHVKLTDVLSGGNYAGVVVDAGPIGFRSYGNNGYDRLDLGGNTFASIIITKANGFLGDVASDSHLGFGPFAIYRADSEDGIGEPFIGSTQMTAVAFESCGHGAIYCEDKTGSVGPNNAFYCTAYNVPDLNFRITPLSITGCGLTNGSKVVTVASTNGLNPWMPVTNANLPSGTVIRSIDSMTQFTVSKNATGTAAGQTLTVSYRTDAGISVGSFSGNDVLVPDLLDAVAGDDHIIDAPNGFSNNRMSRLDGKTLRSTDSMRRFSPDTTIGPSGGASNWFDGNNIGRATLEVAGEDITAGQLLQHGGTLGGFWCVKPYVAGSGKFCIGQATNTVAAGDIVGVVKEGNSVSGIPDAAFVNSGFGTPLTPSAADDGEFTNGTVGTDQIVGYVRNGNVFTLVGRM